VDPVSHFLIGSAVYALAPAEAGAAVAAATLLGAEAPDSDVVIRWARGPVAWLEHHRGPTHGPFGVLGFSAAIAGVISPFTAVPFLSLFLWAVAGAVSHVLFDVTNNYGTQAIWPFSRKRLALDWSPVIDLPLILLLAGGWLVVWLWPGTGRQAVFGIVWAIVLLYYGLRRQWHAKALALVQARFPGASPPDSLSVHPTFLSLTVWRYVVKEEDQFMTGLVSVTRGIVTEPSVSHHRDDAVIAASLQAPTVGVFLRFARHPRAEYKQESPDLYTVRWTDMRYEVDGHSPFSVLAMLDRDLNLLDERLGPRDVPPGDYIRKRLREERGHLS
jgi:inner membrane protein